MMVNQLLNSQKTVVQCFDLVNAQQIPVKELLTYLIIIIS